MDWVGLIEKQTGVISSTLSVVVPQRQLQQQRSMTQQKSNDVPTTGTYVEFSTNGIRNPVSIILDSLPLHDFHVHQIKSGNLQLDTNTAENKHLALEK